jgi:serine/threonine protein kinase
MPASDLRQYDVRDRIGRGSFGEVYLVVHRDTHETFVLKQVRLARQNEWQRAASRLEMQLVSQLHHPFIVPHVESWVDRGHTINMVHAYCSKGDMHSALTRMKVCDEPGSASKGAVCSWWLPRVRASDTRAGVQAPELSHGSLAEARSARVVSASP